MVSNPALENSQDETLAPLSQMPIPRTPTTSPVAITKYRQFPLNAYRCLAIPSASENLKYGTTKRLGRGENVPNLVPVDEPP
jgi:hypothetical protein